METHDFSGDLARDRTPPAQFYIDPATVKAEFQRAFLRSWQLVGHAGQLAQDGDFFTTRIGPEPLLFVNDSGTLRGFFNVCRHRAGPIATGCGRQRLFACRYHGWTYDRSGQPLRAPDMTGVANFDPRRISLEPVRVHRWGDMVFAALHPATPPFEQFHSALITRCAGVGIESMRHVQSHTYEVNSNWKVYIDNFLEGYHIPLVHPELSRNLEVDDYVTEVGPRYVLQRAPMRDGGDNSRTSGNGQALYFWLYPNMMLNIYRGQLQSNVVLPEGVDRCTVRFDWFVPEPVPDLAHDAGWRELMRFTNKIQAEDAGICEAVQRNIVSRAYTRGPYSVQRERGVHYFHSLLRPEAQEQV